jgi:hypothetical protein
LAEAYLLFSEDLKNVRIPLVIDSLGMVPNTMKLIDLMEILKGCAQRQIQELARTGDFLELDLRRWIFFSLSFIFSSFLLPNLPESFSR